MGRFTSPLLRVAENLTRAGDLIRARQEADPAQVCPRPFHRPSPRTRQQGLLVAGHPEHRAGSGRPPRLQTFETLAGGYVGNRFAGTVAGEHVAAPSAGAQRLRQALLRWDAEARRYLYASPTTAAVTTVARVQTS